MRRRTYEAVFIDADYNILHAVADDQFILRKYEVLGKYAYANGSSDDNGYMYLCDTQRISEYSGNRSKA